MTTEQIIHRLNELQKVSNELDLPESERQIMLQKVTEVTDTFINGLPQVRGYNP